MMDACRTHLSVPVGAVPGSGLGGPVAACPPVAARLLHLHLLGGGMVLEVGAAAPIILVDLGDAASLCAEASLCAAASLCAVASLGAAASCRRFREVQVVRRCRVSPLRRLL